MSDDVYDDGNLDAVQNNEIGISGRSLMVPDAVALGGPTWHQGANYGERDTTVTVVDGTECVHDGVAYYGGETALAPEAVAAFLVRSGWATVESEREPAEVTGEGIGHVSAAEAADVPRQPCGEAVEESPRARQAEHSTECSAWRVGSNQQLNRSRLHRRAMQSRERDELDRGWLVIAGGVLDDDLEAG